MRRPAREAAPPLETLAERCRAAGLSLTPQRLAIFQALWGSLDHPSPETLYARVRPRLPSISLATIYKTLDTLVELGMVAELPSTGDAKRYDANMAPHHHLVCDVCNDIEDFVDEKLSALRAPRVGGFTPQSVSVSIHGRCRRCSRASA